MSALERVTDIIQSAAENAQRETADAPAPSFAGSVEFPVDVTIGLGLEGAIACTTEIGYVDGGKGWLVYRGHNIFDLAAFSTFEETSYLLLYGHLPTQKALDEFNSRLLSFRSLPDSVLSVIRSLPPSAHPMSLLRAGVAALGCCDTEELAATPENYERISLKLIAQLPLIVGEVARLRAGLPPVEPRQDLSTTGNFLYMLTGTEPSDLETRIIDISLVLHADHGMNASTFTSMVIASSETDMYSAVVGGIGSLKGPLHGGANERVLYDLDEIGSPENVESWYRAAREQKRKIMGFGHRVYKAYDPRARILGPLAEMICEGKPEIRSLYDRAVKLEGAVIADLGESKKIFPNVDFYSGLIYRAFAIETPLFTPIFAVSRVSGWCARVMEYARDNRIFRPRAVYTGPMQETYVPIAERG